MIVLALLLLVLVAAVVAFVLVEGVDQTVQLSADWIGFSWRPSVIVVFLLGALCLFAAELALALMRGGFRRGRDRRRELKRLRNAERERTAMHSVNEQHGGTSPSTRHDRPESPSAADEPQAHRGSWYDEPPGR